MLPGTLQPQSDLTWLMEITFAGRHAHWTYLQVHVTRHIGSELPVLFIGWDQNHASGGYNCLEAMRVKSSGYGNVYSRTTSLLGCSCAQPGCCIDHCPAVL
jgi:hypothetical protein